MTQYEIILELEERLLNALGKEELYDSLTKALDIDELYDNFVYIARMHDIDIDEIINMW